MVYPIPTLFLSWLQQINLHQETILPLGNFCTRTSPSNLGDSCHYAVWRKFVLSVVSHKKTKKVWESCSKKLGKLIPAKCEYKTASSQNYRITESHEQFGLEGITVGHLPAQTGSSQCTWHRIVARQFLIFLQSGRLRSISGRSISLHGHSCSKEVFPI